MSTHCPQDGGFIGAAGCTHPHHAHSPLVKRILNAKTPQAIPSSDARTALREGFYIDAPNNERVGFGKKLLSHIAAHYAADADARLSRLEFAIATVKSPDAIATNHRNLPNRTAYAKAFKDFGMLVITDKERQNIQMAFTFFPQRKEKLK